jgi:putative flippase GtrA
MIQKNRSLIQLIKFGLVGIMNTLITLAVIYVLMNLFGFDYRLSNLIGYILGLINSFIWNRNWTFKSQGHPLKEIFLFIMAFALCYGIQYLFLLFLVEKLVIDPNIAQPASMIVYTITNFIINKTITFKQK